jgi:AAA domain, putative AbiEii toxin, Type IV TA system
VVYTTRVIKRIRFDLDELASRGLHTKELRELGPRVVLAGPNGGGKTRHLDLVQSALTPNPIAALRHEIDDTTAGSSLHATLIRYAPGTSPENPDRVAPADSDVALRAISEGSYGAVAAGLHIYLEAMARALWNHEHSRVESYPNAIQEFDMAYNFNLLLDELLDTTVEPEAVGNGRIVPLLFGKPFRREELSIGQHVLLCWAILLVRQTGYYQGKIVLLDEPEVYLHPDVCVRAIECLGNALGPHGQIWIATHSLPLIAWSGIESLYFVQDGTAAFAGTTPSKVWQSLLGGDVTRDALVSFLDGDAAAAVTRFASDCLLQPTVASARLDDPQPRQFVAFIAERLRRGPKVRVLEIGAGRGRLVHAIVEMLRGDTLCRADQLTYLAYEDPQFVDAERRAECERHLGALRELGVDAKYSDELSQLRARDVNRVDVVVLANTLHEIPVENWLKQFKVIRGVSKPGASLLVIEDQEPRIGELPHPRGFLILEDNEWEALVDSEIQMRVDEHTGRRLTAFEIPVESLKKASATLTRALHLVRERSIREVTRLRAQPTHSHKAGRRHAFFAMLHLNATLALEVFGDDVNRRPTPSRGPGPRPRNS